MLIEKSRIKITDFKSKRDFPFAPLEAVGPNLSGWGVVETSLLLPNSVCLMVGPLACLRHSAFMAQARSFYKRFYMLPLEEVEIVMGKHFSKVKESLKEIALKDSPQILILAGTCCDHILGTDYKEIMQELKKELGIEVIYLVMAPLTIGLKPSPFEIAYTALYEFLKDKRKEEKEQKAINILGTFLPLSEKSEFYSLLKEAGYKSIYQIPTCKDINELKQMANVCLNIVIHPLGNILAKKMETGMGIPYVFCPQSYGTKEIEQQYQKLEERLGQKLNYTFYKKNIEKLPLDILKNKRVAIGCSINGSPLELACALKQFGAEPKAIFLRNTPKPYEWEYVEWLSDNSAETYIYNVAHPYLNESINIFDDIELVFGVDAGIYCSKAINIPLSRYQNQTYGFETLLWLFEEVTKNITKPISNYDWIYNYNLLI
ncbi:oxidoreductase/nitrogenase component 1 [Thermodesulfobium narugense DSM 14796]|uniref:Oxidoreductase/nitrogenase component 1 n=1 Tax=Thermodesulfobium narugense DSM 14796 TaxID=747365 RepID=M1E5J0_9BACT|nr:oxidoreductase/nitrogenase component 1 [Thermodesulfobium narugense]AEE15127.1 oxidoreductase/nitrogenase component 1 [Thermodesulfobium narugense DSM 14796]